MHTYLQFLAHLHDSSNAFTANDLLKLVHVGLTLTEANYVAVVELLKECYGKKQQISSAHMEELLKLPTCVNDEAIQIRTVYYDRISINVRGQ